MNGVPFLCPMALNVHQKRPSPVTSGGLFHRTIQRETAAPSFVLVWDGAAKLSPSSVIPPHNTTRNRSTVIRFDGRWCSKVIPVIRHSTTQYDTKLRCHHSFLWGMVQQSYPRHPSFHHTIRRETAAPSSVLMGDGAAKLPPSSAVPPHNTTRNRSTIICFDGDGAAKLPPSSAIPPRNTTQNCGAIIRFDG